MQIRSILSFSYTYDIMDRIASKTTPWGVLSYPVRTGTGKIDIFNSSNGLNVDYNYYADSGLLWKRIDNSETL